MSGIIEFIVLIYAIILHEISHGYIAGLFGDHTAKRLGRLTLNPIPHIDIFGSILLPGLFLATGSHFLIGWAKPVPVDPGNFKNPEKDMIWVSLAGPLSNISVAVLCSIFYKVILPLADFTGGNLWWSIILYFLVASVQINLVLAIFNLLPIPPLDGSKVLVYFLSPRRKVSFYRFEPYGFIVIFVLAYLGFLSTVLRFFIQPLLNFLL